jgi:hypothetical protein
MNLTAQNEPACFYRSWLMRIEGALLALGGVTLLFIMPAAGRGWTGGPNPKPAGFDILAGVTLCPDIAGISSVLAAPKKQSDSRN